MSYRFVNVSHYKRGAKWPDGTARMCTRCTFEGRGRRRQAMYTALLRYAGAKTATPVGYCEEHAPAEIRKEEEE